MSRRGRGTDARARPSANGRRRRGRGRRALRVGLKALAVAAATNPQAVRRGFEVDGDWRRIDEAGGAARLTHRQTYRPTHVTGRWRTVDSRLPFDGWRSGPKASGVGLWALIVAVFGWLGWSKGRGPLRGLAEFRHPDEPWPEPEEGFEAFEVPRGDGSYW